MALETRPQTLHINMGPQHPSTHGVLRLELELDGELVVSCKPVIGYLHTGIEKSGESMTYHQSITLTDRMDYLNPLGNNLAYALAVEKLFNCEIPPRAQVARELLAELTRVDDYEALLTDNPLFKERTIGIGVLKAEDALALGGSGPFLRAGGVAHDLRKANPYTGYEQFEFEVPTRAGGDCYDRSRVRVAELRESIRICHQALDRLPDGPVRTPDRKVMAPTRAELQHLMEALIHHL